MHTMPFPRCPAPKGARVKQFLPEDHIADVRGETCRRLLHAGLGKAAKRGGSIAITAGSRGIGGFVELLSGIVDAVREVGCHPFIIPAMGSHGGAVAEGQVEILRRLGVTEKSVGAPIHATMETVTLGEAPNGAVAHLDARAAEADGIIVLGRTKTHPESIGELASGLLKMVTIGLGKQAGAQEAHSHRLWDSVRAVPQIVLAQSKVLFGVAVVENGYRRPLEIEVVPPTYNAFLEADIRLLRAAKSHLATIPFETLDLLILDEIGKNVSGAGMDPNVVGRWRVAEGRPKTPDYHRLVVLNISEPSLGNGLGIGLSDFTTERAAAAYDGAVTYTNLLTASEPGGNTREGPMPLALPSDRDAIEIALRSAIPGAAPRVCRVCNTGALHEMWVSEALLKDVAQNPKLEALEPPGPMGFDDAGNLF